MVFREPTNGRTYSNRTFGLFMQPTQFRVPRPLKHSAREANNIDLQVATFLEKGIIVKSFPETDQFVSTVFLREKKDGTFRMILNLKDFNKWVNYNHFKMDSIHTCTQLMKPNCYMGSIDLKDAYFSIPIHKHHQKYLKFYWKSTLYQFTCLPQGLACAPRLFTKLMKPVFASLRERGHISSGYLDDSLLVGYSYAECQTNIVDTTNLLRNLGLYPHEDKSVTTPTQMIQHLGFILNSIDMTVSLTEAKIATLTEIAQLVLSKSEMPVTLVARLIGHMVSCFPRVEFGELFYRQLEIEKSVALKVEKGNFDAKMTLSDKARSDIHWWISNAHLSNKVINHGSIDLVISTDASLLGWGASLGQKTAGGRWSNVEKEHHINYLELKAVLLGLQSLCSSVSNSHVKVLTDNTTAVAYIRNMGGTRSIECNEMAREIWLWCKEKQIWLSVLHIPGVDNVLADAASRVFDDTTEWKLQEAIYAKITKRWGLPDIDMFASRLNYQTLPYVAWGPDPQAIAADAFTLNWDFPLIYAFPPFSLIAPVLQKIQDDHAEVTIVVPQWTAHPWYSLLVKMLIDRPILLPQDENILYLPFNQNKSHPLGTKLKLMACRLSDHPSRIEEFHNQLRSSYSTPGETVLKNNIELIGKNGKRLLANNLSIPFVHL